MFKSGFLLDTDEKITAALYNQTPVSVWKNGKLYYEGGPIQEQTEEAVYINDGYFLKATCIFKIA
ncbi:hypothetical protein [Cohnella herbarum]|uniref:Uncharacterized protein n=1 Tax=Cohnella herbarum TaxID=2728023 RepID=A0A7Z2VQH7_9BACL|nr:hypothetical protein [Cohnella herbarum]QJD87603.1 hypothetical protein HH215_33425 [Cohnella herbarum]